MITYEIDFTYNIPEWGTIELEAETKEQAEELALESISNIYLDAQDVHIDAIKEKNG